MSERLNPRIQVWHMVCLSCCMSTLFGDIRYAFRAMRQSPGFYGLAIGILALGIGASVSVFSLVDGVVQSGGLWA